MVAARPWLPPGVVGDSVLSAALARIGEAWAERWFEEPSAANVQTQFIRARTKLRNDLAIWSAPAGAFLLTTDHASQIKLAQIMLALSTPRGRRLTEQDNALLRSVAARALADLAANAASLFAIDDVGAAAPPQQTEGALRYSLTFAAGGPAFDLYVDEDVAIAARKALILRAPAMPELGPMRAALADQTVRVGARLGASTLPLPHVRALRPGDVLVLDRGGGAALDLTINDEAKPFALCELVCEATPQLRLLDLRDVLQ